MASFLGGAATQVEDAEWATAVLLHQPGEGERAAAPGRPGEIVPAEARLPPPAGPKWWLYIECRTPPTPAGGLAPDESVRIWLGPTGRPRAVIRASRDGSVRDEATGSAVADTTVVRKPDRWVCQLPVPDACLEADGTLRIAFERTDSRGVRRAWPRPMLPWQTEPGRAAVDTAAWGTLAGPEAAR